MSLPRIPRDPENDYTWEAAEVRRELVKQETPSRPSANVSTSSAVKAPAK